MFMAHWILNTSVGMCHLCFSPGRDKIPKRHSNVTREEMSWQCFASVELNIIRFQTSRELANTQTECHHVSASVKANITVKKEVLLNLLNLYLHSINI